MMNENKTNVTITIRSIETVDDAREEITKELTGQMVRRGDRILIHYEEEFEGVDRPVPTVIHLSKGETQINRMGQVKGRLSFVPGEKSKTNYMSPAGLLELVTDTQVYDLLIDEEGISLRLEYDMELNGTQGGHHELDLDVRIC